MIKLLDILKEIQWLKKSYELASNYYFPFTPNIAKILSKGKTIKSFHVTSFEKLNQLKSLEGTKKSISTMTKTKNKKIRLYRDLKSQWNNGVLCFLEGDVVFQSKSDIMSTPDDTGRRWVKFNNPGNRVNASGLQTKFEKFMSKEIGTLRDEIHDANLKKDFSKETNAKRNTYLKRYINLANKFAQENSEEILIKLGGQDLSYDELSETDEVIINNIKLLDCAYSNTASPEEINLINQIFPGDKIPVPVGTEKAFDIVDKFITDRTI
jgi:hypothetical protein